MPSMEFLFHATSVTLTVEKLTTILKPVFSENGSNKAVVEKSVYGKKLSMQEKLPVVDVKEYL
ncbi:hypothetical protein DPMN_000846 [Dreissena polymorpha]|uniref:Uncharacterized protein n=1 Tax=Dreissena polymorpha TaxID=45954 RepID=A0A9D4RSI3_DREPO|nr:hypothetical protein DPMN_000846 [Dreissena polymorpha]